VIEKVAQRPTLTPRNRGCRMPVAAPCPGYATGMPSLIDRVTRLARSPQGRDLANKAQRIARDPRTRRRITEARERLARRGAR
jgi:hypothetical protein